MQIIPLWNRIKHAFCPEVVVMQTVTAPVVEVTDSTFFAEINGYNWKLAGSVEAKEEAESKLLVYVDVESNRILGYAVRWPNKTYFYLSC